VPAGAEGLVFLPCILGERSPLWDENARGVLFGIHGRHRQEHIIRATIEGTIFSLFSIFEILRRSSRLPITEVRATGGYVLSSLWLGIQASIFNQSILVPEQSEGSAVGAAILGWVALNRMSGLDEAADLIRIAEVYRPDPDEVRAYQYGIEVHNALYTRLADLFVI
jgi:gluconokinase